MILTENPPQLYVDDWGMTKAINEATINLASKDCIQGVSILVDCHHTDFQIDKLLEFKKIEIGLHFNLTEGKAPLYKFFCDRSLLKKELSRQYTKLLKKVGRVNYIDGHHHIHLFPLAHRLIDEFASQHNLGVRVINDQSHPGSYSLSILAKMKNLSARHFFCNYLTPGDLKNDSRFELKMRNSSKKPLVVHISSKVSEKRATSFFENFRNHQFKRIVDYCNEYKP